MAINCGTCAQTILEGATFCPHCGAVLALAWRIDWLPRLLWACPQCQGVRALQVRRPFFGQSSLVCRHCRGNWFLESASGTLTLQDPRTRRVIESAHVAVWVNRLPPRSLALSGVAPGLLLRPGETCLHAVTRARMHAPRQGAVLGRPAGRVELLPGVFERVTRDMRSPSPAELAVVDQGRLVVTDRRVVFIGRSKQVEAAISQLEDAEVDEGFLVLYRPRRTDTFDLGDTCAAHVLATIRAARNGGSAPATSAPEDASPPASPVSGSPARDRA